MTSSQSTHSLELERTYLASEIPAELTGVQPIIMEDTYMPENPQIHAHLRVRRQNNHYEITKKSPLTLDDVSTSVERTIPLDEEEYKVLREASKRRITKERYKVDIEGHAAEVDVFQDGLSGLVLIDFEFNSEQEKAQFVPPSCCLIEVTQKEFLAGGMLSGKSYEDIAPDIESLGYTRLAVQ